MTHWSLNTIGLLTLALASAFGGGIAQAQDARVEEGRDALRDSNYYPWYDAQSDELRRIDVPVSRSDENLGKPNTSERGPQSNIPFLEWLLKKLIELLAALQRMMFALKWVVWIGMTLLLLAVVLFLVRAFMLNQRKRGGGNRGREDVKVVTESEQIENLPFDLRQPTGDLLSEARRLYEAGDYSGAIIYLFSYKLTQLDRRHLIHLAKGKTNRQYLRELRDHRDVAGLLQRTMIAFEEVFFGHYDLDRDRFESCWNSLDQFQQRIGEAG